MARIPLRRHARDETGQAEATPGGRARAELRFDGETVPCREGESLVSALLCAGQMMTSRSAKYRRARGPYCLRGDCGTCLVRIDGRPNQKACMQRARAGQQVASQNKQRADALDPTRLVDAAFKQGMDHHHFMVKPRVLNQVMQTVARELTGFGHLPDAEASAPVGHEHRDLDLLIVGAGPAGRAAAARAEAEGITYAIVDRRDAGALASPGLWVAAQRAPANVERVGIFAAYRDEAAPTQATEAELDAPHRAVRGVWAGHADEGPALRTYAAKHVLVATGARDSMLPLPNNDRPGVVAARGLLELIERDGLVCKEDSIVVVGDGAYAHALADRLRAVRVDPDDVVRIVGRDRVKGIETKDRKLSCDFVAMAGQPAPSHELAVMAGAQSKFDGAGFAIVRDDLGVCARAGGTTIWAAGDVCGYMGPQPAFEDGRRVAETIMQRLREASHAGHPAQLADPGDTQRLAAADTNTNTNTNTNEDER